MNLLHITEEVLSLEKELKEKPLLTNKQEVIGELGRLLTNAVDKRTSGKNSIAFSGGVDSTFLAFMCFKLKKPFVLYNVGVKGASDVEWASKIASFYGWKMKQKIYTLEEAEEVFKNEPRVILEDIIHSQLEKRYMVWGITNSNKRLAVIFTLRYSKIRIISARNMHKKERRRYEKETKTNS